MTARHDALSAADEAVLEALARRLARLDDELPRLQPWQPERLGSGQLHVVRGRTRRAFRPHSVAVAGGGRGSWMPGVRSADRARWNETAILGAAAVVLAAFVAGRSLGGPIDGVAPGASATDASPSAEPAASRVASGAVASTGQIPSRPAPSRPLPDRTRPPVPGVPDGRTTSPVDPDGLRLALAGAGWSCGLLVRVTLEPIPTGLLAKLEATGRLVDGALPADLGPSAIGTDPDRVARMFKGRPLLVDRSGALWIRRGGGSADGAIVQLIATRSPAGALVWRGANVVWAIDCRASSSDLKALLAGRGPAAWPTGQIVDLVPVRASVQPARPIRAS